METQLSIIIPIFNVETYLEECLDSVFQQNLTSFEVICVNDSSTDNSRRLLGDYAAKYSELKIIDQENGGLSHARNSGLSIANGKYIYFLDSDDFLFPGSVLTMLKTIEDHDAEVAGFNALQNGVITFVPSFLDDGKVKPGTQLFDDFYKTNHIYPYNNVWLYLYKKSFLDRYDLRFMDGYYCEDIPFTTMVFFYAKKMILKDIKILFYRKYRKGAITSSLSHKLITDKILINRYLDDFFKKQDGVNKHFYHSMFTKYLTIIEESLVLKDSESKSSYMERSDFKIMKKGIISQYDFKLYYLACINQKLMNNYRRNKLPGFVRRLINIIFSKKSNFYSIINFSITKILAI
jgi:glycosyltransferase involved in cell wall biosynthesis